MLPSIQEYVVESPRAPSSDFGATLAASVDELDRVPLPDLLRASAHGDRVSVASLLAAGAHLEAVDGLGWTALIAAAAGGHVEIVRELVRAGASLAAKAADGWSPMQAAAYGGHVAALEALLDAGAPIEPRATAIAASLGHRAVLWLLLDREPRMPEMNRARYFRARLRTEGHRTILGEKEVLESPFDGPSDYGDYPPPASPEVQYVDRPMTLSDVDASMALVPPPCNARTELTVGGVVFRTVPGAFVNPPREEEHSSIDLPWHEQLTPRLAPHLHGLGRADENVRRESLLLAAQHGMLPVVRVLLRDTRPDPHALTLAAGGGHVEIVRLLLSAGVDTALARGALRRAAWNGELETIRALLDAGLRDELALDDACHKPNPEPVRLLIEYGARVDIQADYQSTPLLSAASVGHVDVLRVLLESGTHADTPSSVGDTALMRAARAEHKEAVALLLASGATVDLVDAHGATALMRTVARGDYPNERNTARMLLDAGANPDLADAKGWTALMHAIDAPSVAMVELLVSRGANVDACDTSGRSVAEHAKRSPYSKEIAAVLRR